MKEFHLPDPGEGLVEADIVRWVVAEGDEVKVNDILVEIETSKSIVATTGERSAGSATNGVAKGLASAQLYSS